MSAVAGRERAVDPRQVRSIVRFMLAESFRAGTDANTGARVRPLRQIVTSMTFLGVLFAMNSARFADLQSYMTMMFALVLCLHGLAALPDTYDVLARRVDILHSKPVSQATYVIAFSLTQLAGAALLATCLGVPILIAAWRRFEASPLLLVGLHALLVLGAFVTLRISGMGLLLLARWVGIDRVRAIGQLVLSMFVFAYSGITVVGILAGMSAHGRPISLAGYPAVKLLPSTWFADALFPGAPFVQAERAGVVVLLLAAAFLTYRVGAGHAYSGFVEALLHRPTRRTRQGWLVRALAAIRRIPWLGRRFATARVCGAASLCLTVTGRDEVVRMRGIANNLPLLAAAAAALLLDGSGPWLLVLAMMGLSGLADEMSLIARGSSPAAAWVFQAAPLSGTDLLRAMRAAVLLRRSLLPLLLLAVVLFRQYPPLAAALLAALYLALGRLLVAVFVALRPWPPLTRERISGQGLARTAVSLIVALAAATTYGIALAVITFLGSAGVVLAGVGMLAALGISLLIESAAARRVGSSEFVL